MASLLVVEDDLDVGEALAEVLRMEENTVRLAHNGEEGLRSLEQEHPDAILLDIEMPVLDGPAMVDRMLIGDRGMEQIPVVLVSGVPDVKRIATDLGTPYYLRKPYALKELFSVLERALQERRPPRQQGLRGAPTQ
jgi:CheY-like chemotaxis protein